jgi:hypothetical protein
MFVSFSSIASSGQTPTQQPQKSHLSGNISIINKSTTFLKFEKIKDSQRSTFLKAV